MRKKCFVIRAALLMAGVITVASSCAKEPKEPIVQNKDIENLVEQATDRERIMINFKENVVENSHYEENLIDDNLHSKIYVDADVVVPDAEKFSILRVETKKFDQEFLDKVINYFVPGQTLYDGACLDIHYSKQELEDWIAQCKEDIDMGDESAKSELEHLQEQYDNYRDYIDYEAYESSGKLVNAADCIRENDDDYFYNRYAKSDNVTMFYGVTDGSDGNFQNIYIQNSEHYGTAFRYSKCQEGQIGSLGIWPRGFYDYYNDNLNVIQDERKLLKGESLTISKEEAEKYANDFISAMGIDGLGLYSIEEWSVCPGAMIKPGEWSRNSRPEYVFTYWRNIGNVFALSGDEKFSSDEYGMNKYVWSFEQLVIEVNDNGIVGIIYNAPLKVSETVVDMAGIKPFEEIKEIFREMTPIIYANDELPDTYAEVDVDRIELGYAIISEQDNFNAGLLVPVWNFYGKYGYEGGGIFSREMVVMTINAIDGTVIDREKGY